MSLFKIFSKKKQKNAHDFANEMLNLVHIRIEQNKLLMNYNDAERRIIAMFYNPALKEKRKQLAQFQIYAEFCKDKSISFYGMEINKADAAISNLESINYIVGLDVSNKFALPLDLYVGRSCKFYGLTSDGLEALQSVHPSVALKIKGWISVMPPWIVMVGTIGGGVSAAWKFFDVIKPVILDLYSKFL